MQNMFELVTIVEVQELQLSLRFGGNVGGPELDHVLQVLGLGHGLGLLQQQTCVGCHSH